MQARCLAVSMMVWGTGAVGAWVVVIRVFFRQSFVTFGPSTTMSPTVRILLPSSTSQAIRIVAQYTAYTILDTPDRRRLALSRTNWWYNGTMSCLVSLCLTG